MKSVIDSRGNLIEGLFRNSDGSLTINNSAAYQKNKSQHDKFASITRDVAYLRETLDKILEKINGS